MNPENLQEEAAAERNPAALHYASGEEEDRTKSVALKFGGSSLLGAERMLHAARLVREAASAAEVAVVVSAMKGITDRLINLARLVDLGKMGQAQREAEAVLDAHLEVLSELQLSADCNERVRRELALLGRDLLHEVRGGTKGVASAEAWDRMASYGERLSARLFAGALEKEGVAAVPVASSDFVVTCATFRDAQPIMDETKRRGGQILEPLLEGGIVPVVTGFIGSTQDGRITTLGRNSSDFSGALVAHVIDADELVIWTDVDGIYTANPNVTAEARLLHELSYDEAHALAASGAKVLHPKVLPLAAESEMVVWVRNAFNPGARGTRIGSRRNPGPVPVDCEATQAPALAWEGAA
jgi:bifunctional aspartokinase / homoserine dehydrogenase 1